jgi:NADH-quinone oxidoreductase subunit J
MLLTLENILFIIFAIVAVFSAIMMVTRRSPITSAIYLIVNFLMVAGIYLLLNAQFLAIIQVLVYMGAIMVLFLFVILLLNLQDEKKLIEKITYTKISGILLSILLVCLLGYTVYYGFYEKYPALNPNSVDIGTAQTLGKNLILNYSFPFEIAGFLLLAAVVGAVVLAKKKFE